MSDKLLTAVQLHTKIIDVNEANANTSKNPILYSTKIMEAAGIVANQAVMDELKKKAGTGKAVAAEPKPDAASVEANATRKAAEAKAAREAAAAERKTALDGFLRDQTLPSFEDNQTFSDIEDFYRYMIQNTTKAKITLQIANIFKKPAEIITAEIAVEVARKALLDAKQESHNSLYTGTFSIGELESSRGNLDNAEKVLQEATTDHINGEFLKKITELGVATLPGKNNAVDAYIFYSRLKACNVPDFNKVNFNPNTEDNPNATEEDLKTQFEGLLGIESKTVNPELLSIYVDELERLILSREPAKDSAINSDDKTVNKIITGETLYNSKNPTSGLISNTIAKSALQELISIEYKENVGGKEVEISIPTDFNGLFDNLEGEENAEERRIARRIARRMLNKVRQEYRKKIFEIERINSGLIVSIPDSITDQDLIKSGVSRDFLYDIARMTGKEVKVVNEDAKIKVTVTGAGMKSLNTLFSNLIAAHKALAAKTPGEESKEEQKNKNEAQEAIFTEIDLIKMKSEVSEKQLTGDAKTALKKLTDPAQKTRFQFIVENVPNLIKDMPKLANSLKTSADEACYALTSYLNISTQKIPIPLKKIILSRPALKGTCFRNSIFNYVRGGTRKKPKFTKNKKGGKKKRTLKRSNKKSLKRNKQTGGDVTVSAIEAFKPIIDASKAAEDNRKTKFETEEKQRKAEEMKKFYTILGSQCKEGIINNNSGSSGYIVGSAYCSTSYHCKKFVNVKINGKGHTVFNGLPRFKYTDKEGNTRYDPEYCAPVAYIEYHNYAAGTETTNEYGQELLDAIKEFDSANGGNEGNAKAKLDTFIPGGDNQNNSLLIIDGEFCAVDNEGNINKIGGAPVELTHVSYGNGQEKVAGNPFKIEEINNSTNEDGYITVTTPLIIGTENKNITPILA